MTAPLTSASCPAGSGVGDDEDWFEVFVGQEGQLNINLSDKDQERIDENQQAIVDARKAKPYFGNTTFDFVPFFLEDARFREAWQRYSLVGSEADPAARLRRLLRDG